MAIYLSHPLSSNTPLYGGAKNIDIAPNTKIRKGDTANSLMLSFPNHAGTHLDVPYHFFENGKKLTDYDPHFWIFNHPLCIDVPSEDGYLVKYEDVVDSIKSETDLLLIRTGYEKFRMKKKYWSKNPGLSASLAMEIRKNHANVRAVGVDFISISSRRHRIEGRKAHCEFLGDQYDSDPIVLVEDMSLLNFTTDISSVIISPLLIKNGDGAPCTVTAL